MPLVDIETHYYIIYNCYDFRIRGRYYFEKDAMNRARKIAGEYQYSQLIVENLHGLTETQWKMWKTLQRSAA
jgi:hypothetical protein